MKWAFCICAGVFALMAAEGLHAGDRITLSTNPLKLINDSRDVETRAGVDERSQPPKIRLLHVASIMPQRAVFQNRYYRY